MDSWSHSEVLSTLEGGNKQLNDFFERHNLPPSFNQSEKNRYKTNAAAFYRDNLCLHVQRVQNEGTYKGRHSFRKKTRRRRNLKRSHGVKNESVEGQTTVGA